MNLYYSPDYIAADYVFDTTRKSGWIADSLYKDPIPGVVLTPPRLLEAREFGKAHSMRYVDAVRTGQPEELATSQGFEWSPGLWTAVRASTSGMVAAALDTRKSGIAGSLSSGLHHAGRDYGKGFCTLNGLAVAALAALESGAEGILILDLDAHFGGGTYSNLHGEPRVHQIDISTSWFDDYQPAEDRFRVEFVDRPDRYLDAIREALQSAAENRKAGSWRFDLCLYNAGMDIYGTAPDPERGRRGLDELAIRDREGMVFDWCADRGLPVAFCMAGGYLTQTGSVERLVQLHRITLEEAARVRDRCLAAAPRNRG